jgi:hypothetical protein
VSKGIQLHLFDEHRYNFIVTDLLPRDIGMTAAVTVIA